MSGGSTDGSAMRISPFLTRPCKFKKPIRTDPQRHLVYTMERQLIGISLHCQADPDHLRAVLRHACRKYKVPEPELKIRNVKERWFGGCREDYIELNARFHGNNLFTLLHELAHWITWQVYGNVEDHGPEFVSYYAELLDAYKVIPFDAFLVLLNEYGIEIA